MNFFFRAVITGFAWSLGKALFEKVQHRVGLGRPDKSSDAKQDGVGDPHVQQTVS